MPGLRCPQTPAICYLPPLGAGGHVISACLCTFSIGTGRSTTSPAVHCPRCTRGRSHGTGATRLLSTEPCSARFPRYSPWLGGVHRYGAMLTCGSLRRAAERTAELGKPAQVLTKAPDILLPTRIGRARSFLPGSCGLPSRKIGVHLHPQSQGTWCQSPDPVAGAARNTLYGAPDMGSLGIPRVMVGFTDIARFSLTHYYVRRPG